MYNRKYHPIDGTEYPPHDLVREDGRLEKMCPHGIGHTVGHIHLEECKSRYTWVHGCDGCCGEYKTMMPAEFQEDIEPR